MIVDDDAMVRRMLSRVLEHEGYRVLSHDSGFGLSSKVREHRPDLLVLDVDMPGLGGPGALEALRALAGRFQALTVPVLFHSGLPAPRLEALARQYGASGYLCKPASNGDLLGAICSLLSEDDTGLHPV